jgi:hypothetical protein
VEDHTKVSFDDTNIAPRAVDVGWIRYATKINLPTTGARLSLSRQRKPACKSIRQQRRRTQCHDLAGQAGQRRDGIS